MAKKKSEDEAMQAEVEKSEKGEQMALMDVGPENAKEIVDAVRVYKRHQADRRAALKKEVELKDVVKELVKKADLKRLPNGNIEFECDGAEVAIMPQDDLITIKEKTPKKSKKSKKAKKK